MESLPERQPPFNMKRSHSQEVDVLHTPPAPPAPHTKRARAGHERPPLANLYLESRSAHELVELIRRVEALLQHTPYAAHLNAILYPDRIEAPLTGRAAADQQSAETDASAEAPPAASTDASAAPPTVAPVAPPSPSVPRPYTPSIPANVDGSSAPAPSAALRFDGIPATNVSSRIAAILDSIQHTNSSGPMLGLQGQPLAPSKQASGTNTANGLSSLLGNANMASSRLSPHTPLSTGTAPRHETVLPRVDVPAPTPGPFDHTRLGSAHQLGAQSIPGTNLASFSHYDTHQGEHTTRTSPRVTSTLPSYEDMIVEGLQAIGDVNGTPPRMLFHWMEDTYPLMKNFRPSASQALQKAFKRGRLHKVGSLYRINPDWDGSNQGRKPTRRPQVGKDHPMMVNGPKGPAPASPFKARAQFQGAAAYRQTTSPFNKQRNGHARLLQSLRPGPKPYGQPGAAPLDNPASSIFQNGAAAAALLLAHQQRSRGEADCAPPPDLTPTLSSLVQQLRSSAGSGDASGSSLSGVLANALLKHAQRPFATTHGVQSTGLGGGAQQNALASSPVLQSLTRLISTNREDDKPQHDVPGAETHTAPSLSASIETLMQQATRAAQASQGDAAQSLTSTAQGTASQADLDAAVSQTLEAAFQQIGSQERKDGEAHADHGGDAELDGINLSDYSDALRTLSAALSGFQEEDEESDENAQHLADERAIAEAEADPSEHDEHDELRDEPQKNRMSSLLKSYGIDISGDALTHLTETLRDPNVSVPALSHKENGEEGDEDKGPADFAALLPSQELDMSLSGAEAAKNQAIQSQLEALIASLASEGQSDGEEE
ncbi:hypothetical protein MVES1_003426 [Malassezia vespertilionis]|uniref:Histone H1 n=1 Tax=Malassezia vespertilionis TaxID=2020962 RepID=A0A2N1J7F4_9BASI|nr:uncharacterized protein MVES1_003426 [Malassezia vespertilionis]PKI82488.1 hypothetical protein MVES_003665 [Malassezia vespertilionis]WFD08057.1 hypothetical protein MVES1_003426 [Malassezia vespertilionis]